MEGTLAVAQTDTGFHRIPLSLNEYLDMVTNRNRGYAAQQYNINIAEAGIETAKIFPDPQLSLDGFDNQHRKLKLAYGANAGLGTTLELGGKRRARIGLARSNTTQSRAEVADFYRNLRADATLAWFNALQQYHLLQVQRQSCDIMKQLADGDSIRFSKGVITENDALQSRLEADHLQNDMYQNLADWKAALVQLNIHTGRSPADALIMPAGDFDALERHFNTAVLISDALEHRSDVVAAVAAKDAADKSLVLAKANRKIDIGVNVGGGYNAEATSEIAPTPQYYATTAGISIPLKFSNRYKGELHAAKYSIKQAAAVYDQLRVEVQAAVNQSWVNYHAARLQVQQFEKGLLQTARKVLDGKIYAYRRGESPLLEVLNAQRTNNDLQQEYYKSLYNYAAALVELERAAGIWDLK